MDAYEHYKDSGVPWIGEIPTDWAVEKTKYQFEIRKRQVKHDEQTILSITQEGIRPKDVSHNEGQMAKTYDGYQEVHSGDFAMNSMDLLTGWVDLSVHDGLTSPDYRVFAPLSPESMEANYYRYVFQLLYSRRIYYKYGQGVSNLGRWRLQAATFQNFPLPKPPVYEQREIGKYLDSKTAEIDGVVEGLVRQRELLERYKRELIAHTVTKGLDTNAPMKDSGIEWIGKIPNRWHSRSLKSLLTRKSRKGEPSWRVLSVERERGVVDRELEGSPDNNNRLPDDLSGYLVVRNGQFVMNKMKAWQGSYGVSPYDGIVSPAYYAFDLSSSVDSEFFNWAIRSKAYIPFFGRDSYGIRTDQWDFKVQALRNIPLFVPPVEEQRQIVDYLVERLKGIDGLIADLDRQVGLLGRYRKQVINDVVTGKIRVSEEA